MIASTRSLCSLLTLALLAPLTALAQVTPNASGGEANLILPDLSTGVFFGTDGRHLLMIGLVICALGLLFGLLTYRQLRDLPVHTSMREVSELIWETCKTYLFTQGRFLLILELFIGTIILIYFGYFRQFSALKVLVILLFSLIGIGGSYGVAWYGIRVNTFANSRTAFASLRGLPYPCYQIPLRAGMSIGMVLISVELLIMLCILLFIPSDYAGPCFIGFAIGESLGAAALRVAGGIFTKIADIGADLMKIVFNVKEDDARNPGVIADCTGDNAGDSVGPSADGFETYGVTGVALISFILLAVHDPLVQVQLLVWIFVMRIMMVISSAASYFINEAIAKAKYGTVMHFNYEHPLTFLVWLTSVLSVILTFVVSYFMIPDLGGDTSLWWKLSGVITCGTLAGAVIPELVKVFTSTESRHVREVVTSSREGGASLNILSGLVAGNFSAFWLGMTMLLLMAAAFGISTMGLGSLMLAPAVFAFGLVAFGFLGMGPVTIAVDSYGPVTDNAQSVYELSLIEDVPGIIQDLHRNFGFTPDFRRAKENLEENDGAGNTFKATAKPVLIGTAVVGATTMIFSIIVALTNGLTTNLEKLSILHPPFLLGLMGGGAIVYWFTGASMQAVTTGAYRAVEYIKQNMKLEGATKASVADSKAVVGICTQYAQKGMFNIFLAVFFATLAFAFAEPFLFIGYLISIALFGLYQAIFMANAGGAWDNAKKIVETELKQKGTDLHSATVVGDTVGDPFKDTSSVALNPIIKFTTLFGLLAVELAVSLAEQQGETLGHILSAIFFAIALFFVYRSFYGMRIVGASRKLRPTRRTALLTAGGALAAAAQTLGPPPHPKGPKVYLDYDQIELDAAYDQTVYEPDIDQLSAKLKSDSDVVRARIGDPVRTAYGPKPIEQLDIYRTNRIAPTGAPIFIFIHGGRWRVAIAHDYGFPAENFTRAGAHFIAPDFDWVQDVNGDLGVLVSQVRRSVAWVYNNAKRIGGDPSRIYLGGHSSGGHLAGVALTTSWKDLSLPEDVIKGGVLLSGIYDLKPVRISNRSSYVKIDDAAENAYSPQRHIDKLTVPLVVAWGTRETPEFQRQSRDFAAAVKGAGKPVEAIVAENYVHMESVESLANPYGIAGSAALKMMKLA